MPHHHTAPTANVGLLISLAHCLPGSSPLRRRAVRTAAKLNRRHDRALDTTAAELLAQLLDATDCAEAADYDAEGVLDRQFDD